MWASGVQNWSLTDVGEWSEELEPDMWASGVKNWSLTDVGEWSAELEPHRCGRVE
jgi:hypothetical protein